MIRRVVFWFSLMLLLGACGADGSEDSASRLSVTSNTEVAELLGTTVGDDEVRAEFQTIHARSEELTAQCMASAGFDYEPVEFQPGTGEPVQVTATSLGIADQYFGAFSTDYEELPPDPNIAIVEALSEADRLAYSAALQGEGLVFDARFSTEQSINEGLAAGELNQTGCRFEAQQVALAETGRNQELIESYRRLGTGMLQTDQRMIRARVEWARCMAEAGLGYRDEGAMTEDLAGQALAVLQDLVALRDEGVELVPGQEPPPEAAELIDDLYEREAEVAGAHADCRGPMDAAIAQVRADVDELFLENNS